MKKILFYLTIAIAGLQLAACGDKKKEMQEVPAGHEGHKEQEAHEEGENVTLTAEQLRTASIETSSIEQKNLTGTLKISGVLKVPNEHRATATSLFSGTIRSISIKPGSYVRKGQVIATIANAEFTGIQQQYIENEARLKLAEQEYDRQQQLVKGNAAPAKNLQRAAAERTALQTTRQSLRQQLELMGVTPGKLTTTIPVKSPINGSVSHISAQIGALVNPSTPIAEIVNNADLHLDAYVYEQDLDKVHEGQEINFTLTNSTDGKTYKARIFSIGTAFEQETKAIPVHAHVLGTNDHLIDGMSATGLLNLSNNPVPAVPSDAVVTIKGQDYILVAVEGGEKKTGGAEFRKVAVARGVTDLGYTGITPVEALPANTLVVTKGAYFIVAAMTNTGEHEH